MAKALTRPSPGAKTLWWTVAILLAASVYFTKHSGHHVNNTVILTLIAVLLAVVLAVALRR